MNNGIILADKIKQKAKSLEEDASEMIKMIQIKDKEIDELKRQNESLRKEIKPISHQ
jgi:FtsZ-binding cell division protein ZapB